MRLSLVMATVGRTEEVGRLIQSLIDQNDRNFELIVVDQNLDDRLNIWIQTGVAQGLDIRHTRLNPPNLSIARNIGISFARYELLAFPDDDCWYERTVIESVRNRFNSAPEVSGVVARWVEQADEMGYAQASGQLSLSAWRRFRGGQGSSISLFFRRELFNALGGFDERLGIGRWYGSAEDTDFLLRALASGARFDHAPEARIHHYFSTEEQGDWRTICRHIRNRARGTGAIYAKHRLDPYVVIRGCSAPFLLLLLKLCSPRYIIRGWFMIVGRLEGFIRWKLKEDKIGSR